MYITFLLKPLVIDVPHCHFEPCPLIVEPCPLIVEPCPLIVEPCPELVSGLFQDLSWNPF